MSKKKEIDFDDIPIETVSLSGIQTLENLLFESKGFFNLGCGCYVRITPEALGVVDTILIAENFLQVAGSCIHDAPMN